MRIADQIPMIRDKETKNKVRFIAGEENEAVKESGVDAIYVGKAKAEGVTRVRVTVEAA